MSELQGTKTYVRYVKKVGKAMSSSVVKYVVLNICSFVMYEQL